jgi:predicted ATPase/DNA-binding CsgD family transcriptional regulator
VEASSSQVAQPDLAARTVTPLPSVARPHRLPVPLTSFVGRASELDALPAELMATRLLTLTGPGGCGKTRLALRAAADQADRFPHGVWWVALGSLADERRVGAAVADALEVRPLPGRTSLDAASAYLATRRSLLVLDNCEHLLDACARAVGALLTAAPDLVVLATSRAPLGVDGETDWRVPPMSQSGAESLFVERARKARPGFGADAESVARVCAKLDGLPLAIELAAARVRSLSVDQIATGLARRFRLLTGGPRTATERHQTLRASVDWSHDLLSDDERVLLRRLAVFAGGFTQRAAEEVCAGDGIEPKAVLDLLASLVGQSLVIAAERDRAMRYRLLETMGEFALERLAEHGEEHQVRARHCDAYLALAEEAGPQHETGRQREWLERLDPETANLEAAIDYALATDPVRALRLCAALYRWWGARGRFAEAELAHSRVLAACCGHEPALRARVLHGRAYLAVWSGDFRAGEAHATEALALAEQVGDRATAARARCQLGAARHFADPRTGRAELARASEFARGAGDEWALGTAAWLTVSSFMWQNDQVRAARANEAVAVVAERTGDPFQLARHWLNLAWIACIDGRFAEGRAAIERLRAAVAGIGEPVLEAIGDHFMAYADTWQGRPARALEHQQASLARALTLGAGSVVPWLTLDMSFAEIALGRLEQARDRIEAVLPVVEGRVAYGTAWGLCQLAEVRRLLGDGAADATAVRAQAGGDRIGNRLIAAWARLTRGRLASEREEWPAARQHALAHLDACVEGGHRTYVPAGLDALAEVAAGLHRDIDAARLFAAADRARLELGVVRVPAEDDHWAGIDSRLRDSIGDTAYATARAEGAELTTGDALAWARRARGPRGRPPGGWASLTPTEARVVGLVTEGLSNRQIGERMFVSPETVKTHLAHVYGKLGMHNRAALIARTVRRDPAK